MNLQNDLARLEVEVLWLREELEQRPPHDAGELRALRGRFLLARDSLRQLRMRHNEEAGSKK